MNSLFCLPSAFLLQLTKQLRGRAALAGKVLLSTLCNCLGHFGVVKLEVIFELIDVHECGHMHTVLLEDEGLFACAHALHQSIEIDAGFGDRNDGDHRLLRRALADHGASS
jgi:hypothetical protein